MKPIDHDEKYFVLVGMRIYGGGFVKALGEALAHADSENQQKIEATWPEYWEQYYEMGKIAEDETQ